ncbi:hypothetical protein SeMB42_g01218 [Synchytrium endobioticum]|uniref:Uncharacterized protein n=1 Tax=Synchytrium endobioticum TaxID=286115 RepID=A0A507DMV1_9FUNG|nr:hypothetical protein SeMB42_g01218 [Synchytrium endobioticum]
MSAKPPSLQLLQQMESDRFNCLKRVKEGLFIKNHYLLRYIKYYPDWHGKEPLDFRVVARCIVSGCNHYWISKDLKNPDELHEFANTWRQHNPNIAVPHGQYKSDSVKKHLKTHGITITSAYLGDAASSNDERPSEEARSSSNAGNAACTTEFSSLQSPISGLAIQAAVPQTPLYNYTQPNLPILQPPNETLGASFGRRPAPRITPDWCEYIKCGAEVEAFMQLCCNNRRDSTVYYYYKAAYEEAYLVLYGFTERDIQALIEFTMFDLRRGSESIKWPEFFNKFDSESLRAVFASSIEYRERFKELLQFGLSTSYQDLGNYANKSAPPEFVERIFKRIDISLVREFFRRIAVRSFWEAGIFTIDPLRGEEVESGHASLSHASSSQNLDYPPAYCHRYDVRIPHNTLRDDDLKAGKQCDVKSVKKEPQRETVQNDIKKADDIENALGNDEVYDSITLGVEQLGLSTFVSFGFQCWAF